MQENELKKAMKKMLRQADVGMDQLDGSSPQTMNKFKDMMKDHYKLIINQQQLDEQKVLGQDAH